VLGLLLWLAQGDGDWLAALEQRDYRRAWEARASLPAGLSRARAETRILYQAGDPAGALAAARRGLESDPQQLELLFYAAGSALWLREAEPAKANVTALELALGQADLTPEELLAWKKTVQEYAGQSSQLAAEEALRRKAVTVARAGALLGLLAALASLLHLARKLGR